MGLIIDNFAGGGGASVALEEALGRPVDIAINHDPDAIAMHKANHPDTLHLQEDVFAIRPAELCAGRPIDVAWFSPDCKHFSRAKGGAPVSKKIRGLAWVVLRWASLPKWQRPRVIFLENVTEFQTWCPVKRNGQPDMSKKGETFRLWVSHLEALGYAVEWRELVASDFGAPTIRKRLFLVARCDGEPIHWPEPTHGDPSAKGFRESGLSPWRTAAEIIDWSIPCPSIFERKRPLADKTLARIARGIQRYVIDDPQPFIVNLTHGVRLESIDLPMKTITGANRGEKALVAPTLIQTGYGEREGQSPRTLDLQRPLGTVVAGGSKHALVAAFLAQHNGGPRNGSLSGRSADAPISTITGRGTQQQLVTSHLLKLRGTCKDGQPVTEPAPTITAGGMHIGEVRAFLLKYYGAGVGQSVKEPLHTVTVKERFGLVTIHGETFQIADIGMRMLAEHELYAAQGFLQVRPDYAIRPVINGKKMTKTASIARCGNSVSPPPAIELVRANAPMFSILHRPARNSPPFAPAYGGAS
jgi:DNA (cytosine-5)-methyltransferase 1